MKVALDTNRYSDLLRGDPEIATKLRGAAQIFLPFAVVAELRCGFLFGSRLRQNENSLLRFMARPNVRVLYADDATTHQYATVYAHLRRQGTPIPMNDMWIAALCLQHDLTRYARDAHFDHIPQLKRL